MQGYFPILLLFYETVGFWKIQTFTHISLQIFGNEVLVLINKRSQARFESGDINEFNLGVL